MARLDIISAICEIKQAERQELKSTVISYGGKVEFKENYPSIIIVNDEPIKLQVLRITVENDILHIVVFSGDESERPFDADLFDVMAGELNALNEIVRSNFSELVLNSAEDCEPIEILLDPIKNKVSFNNKIKELLDEGAFETREEAEKWLKKTPIELELYYHIGRGLFAVESEVVERGVIYSPYNCEKYLNKE